MGEVKQINTKNRTYYFYNDDEYDYEKNYMKIKSISDNNLPLNKPLKFRLMAIIIRCVFKEDGKFYPQRFLHDTLYELNI